MIREEDFPFPGNRLHGLFVPAPRQDGLLCPYYYEDHIPLFLDDRANHRISRYRNTLLADIEKGFYWHRQRRIGAVQRA